MIRLGSFAFMFHGSALNGSWIQLSSKYGCIPGLMLR